MSVDDNDRLKSGMMLDPLVGLALADDDDEDEDDDQEPDDDALAHFMTTRAEWDALVRARSNETIAASAAPVERKRAAITLGPETHLTVDQTIAALSNLPDLFQRAGRLVQVADGRIFDLTAPALTTQMSRAAKYYVIRMVEPKKDDGADVVQPRVAKSKSDLVPIQEKAAPPGGIAKSVADAGVYPGVRELVGVTRVPQLRPDGRVVCEPGYDQESGLWYAGPRIVLPERPKKDDAIRAVARLLEVVEHFPFQDLADKSAWLALVLTVVMRALVEGSTPLFVGSANQARTGKTLSMQLATLIATGELALARLPPHSEEEWDKTVAAILLHEHPDVALIDNVPTGTSIGCATLDAALTSTSVGVRILGRSETRTVEKVRTVFGVTSNGATYRADTAPRTIPIRLHCDETNPSERPFKGDIRAETRKDQPVLLAAALTIARAFIQAEPTPETLPAFGSFEAWTLIRQVLRWVDQPDPWLTRASIADRDIGASDHDRIVGLVADLFGDSAFVGATLAEKVEAVDEKGDPRPRGHSIDGAFIGWSAGEAQDVLNDLGVWDRGARRVDRRALGYLLRNAEGRPNSDGQRIEATGRKDSRLRCTEYRVVKRKPKVSE